MKSVGDFCREEGNQQVRGRGAGEKDKQERSVYEIVITKRIALNVSLKLTLKL